VGRTRIEQAPTLDFHRQLGDFMDRLSAPIAEFAVDEYRKRICFKGGFFLERADYRLFYSLLKNHRNAWQSGSEVPFTSPGDLADKLEIGEQSMRQQITRTREKLAGNLTVQQGIVLPEGSIENSRIKGYRLSPHLREVPLVDIISPDKAMSHALPQKVTGGSRGA
jgi:hypothetical protein